MSASKTLDTAVSLAEQATHQDRCKNYVEASRCYRDAIAIFTSLRTKCADAQVLRAIDGKIYQYRQRLVKIDRYLLSKADLTQLFKSAVEFHHCQPEEQLRQTTSPNDAIHEGLAQLELGKKRDAQRRYKDALRLYEGGVRKLLETTVGVLHEGGESYAVEKTRFNCLLIHERIDAIRDHLEKGAPIQHRRNLDDELAAVARGSSMEFCSNPKPLATSEKKVGDDSMFEDDEDAVFQMDEIRSHLSSPSTSLESSTFNICFAVSPPEHSLPSSNKGSYHSLYPDCEIQKRSPSVCSGHSDFVFKGPEHPLIPLADLDQELALSSVSMMMMMETSSTNVNEAQSSIFVPPETQTSARHLSDAFAPEFKSMLTTKLSKSEVDLSSTDTNNCLSKFRSMRTIDVDDEYFLHVKKPNSLLLELSRSPVDEKDRNISEILCCTNIDKYRLTALFNDSGSDSGIFDPTCKHQDNDSFSNGNRSPVSSGGTKSTDAGVGGGTFATTSDVDSLYCCEEIPLLQKTVSPPPLHQTTMQKKKNYPCHVAVNLCRDSSSSSPSNQSRKSCKNLTQAEDELTIISEDTIVDDSCTDSKKGDLRSKITTSSEVYGVVRPRNEYIPPRAFARNEDGNEDDFNKGCYYLFSCLDAFWIL